MKTVYDNAKYMWRPIINDPDPSSCTLTITVDDTSGVVTITPITSPTEYQITIGEIQEDKKLIKIVYTLTDSNGIINDPEYEYLLILKRPISIGVGQDIDEQELQKYLYKEELIYHDMLISSIYQKSYYDIFIDENTIDSYSGLIYDQTTNIYSGVNGSWMIDTVINGVDVYDTFLAHVEVEDGTNFTLEYSINNGSSWTIINPDEDITITGGFTNLQLRITLNNDGEIHSLGVLYDKEIFPPEIYSISWDDDEHIDAHEYIMIINAIDPNGETLTYDVTCDDPNVIITQDGTYNEQFHVTYPNYSSTVIVTYTITVTNQSGLTDQVTEEKIISNEVGERGVFGNGSDAVNIFNIIDYITINTLGNALDFGNLTTVKNKTAATSNGTNQRGVFGGGYDGSNFLNTVDYITINTLGDAQDFGDLTTTRHALAATSNGTSQRGVFGGGSDGATYLNIIDYITISTLGDALDFGDITVEKYKLSATSNGINERGVLGGGRDISGQINIIDYITINTLGNASDFGDLTTNREEIGSCSNGINERGVFGGGWSTSLSRINVIDYITINILNNALDFGDLITNKEDLGACSNGTNERGVFGGGNDIAGKINVIDYITINILGNSQDFGDLTIRRDSLSATSDS